MFCAASLTNIYLQCQSCYVICNVNQVDLNEGTGILLPAFTKTVHLETQEYAWVLYFIIIFTEKSNLKKWIVYAIIIIPQWLEFVIIDSLYCLMVQTITKYFPNFPRIISEWTYLFIALPISSIHKTWINGFYTNTTYSVSKTLPRRYLDMWCTFYPPPFSPVWHEFRYLSQKRFIHTTNTCFPIDH